jgi:peptidyl-tRNA hydrolase
MKKLYVIARADLKPGLLAAQACHAAAAFCLEEGELAKEWREENNLILLSSPTKETLAELLYKLEKRGVKTVHFTEPDLGGELTAIACREGATPLVRSLPLALQAA